MAAAEQPPSPQNAGGGAPAKIRDARAVFTRLSGKTPRDAGAERAFVEARIQMIRNDAGLSQSDKRRAIRELRTRADGDR